MARSSYIPAMSFTRRDMLLTTAVAMGCAATPRRRARAPGIGAVALDAFVVFDPRPLAQALEASFPGQGSSLATAFRSRLFDYGWLRALGERYRDFWQLSEDALDATAQAHGLELAPSARAELLEVWGSLPPWPDAVEGLRALSRQRLELAVLSNWSPRMLEDALGRSGLREVVRPLSTDSVRTYKPDPRAYALALDAFALDRSRIRFVAFAGWDAAGAAWFGFPTVWMNRAGAPPEPLDLHGVSVASSFADLPPTRPA